MQPERVMRGNDSCEVEPQSRNALSKMQVDQDYIFNA